VAICVKVYDSLGYGNSIGPRLGGSLTNEAKSLLGYGLFLLFLLLRRRFPLRSFLFFLRLRRRLLCWEHFLYRELGLFLGFSFQDRFLFNLGLYRLLPSLGDETSYPKLCPLLQAFPSPSPPPGQLPILFPHRFLLIVICSHQIRFALFRISLNSFLCSPPSGRRGGLGSPPK